MGQSNATEMSVKRRLIYFFSLSKWTEFGAVTVMLYYTGLCVVLVTVLKGVRYGQRGLEDKSLQRKSEGEARYMKS